MNLKKLKNFLNPNAEKILLMLVIDFFFTFILLMTSDSIGVWTYILSPNILYLENTISLSSGIQDIAFHGAISNTLDILYLYFLSCTIARIYDLGRKK